MTVLHLRTELQEVKVKVNEAIWWVVMAIVIRNKVLEFPGSLFRGEEASKPRGQTSLPLPLPNANKLVLLGVSLPGCQSAWVLDASPFEYLTG